MCLLGNVWRKLNFKKGTPQKSGFIVPQICIVDVRYIQNHHKHTPRCNYILDLSEFCLTAFDVQSIGFRKIMDNVTEDFVDLSKIYCMIVIYEFLIKFYYNIFNYITK